MKKNKITRLLEPTCNAGDPGSIPMAGRPPGGGHGNMDRGAWRAAVHEVSKSWIQLSD